MTRPSHVARIAGGLATIVTVASCSQGPVVTPTPTTRPQVQLNANGTIPACRPELVAFTVQVRVLGSPRTTAVAITSTVIDRGRYACALPQPTSACFTDPTAEVTTTDGHLVWSPRYLAIPCPWRPPDALPVLVSPGQPFETTQTWDLAICRAEGCPGRPTAGGSTRAGAAAGTYAARGASATVGNARGVAFAIR